MSDEGLKRRWARLAPVLLVVLSIGGAGVAWTGCGGGDGDSTGEFQERIEKGSEEAKKGIEKGKQEVEKGIEEGKREAEKGLEKGKAEAQKGIEGGKQEAQEGVEAAEGRVQGY